MSDILIRISETRAMQALEGYKKDVQTFLVEKAVVDYFERHSTLSIKDTLKASGFAGNGRKQSARGGNGRKQKPPVKEKRPGQGDTAAHEQAAVSSTSGQKPPQERFERTNATRRVVEVGIGADGAGTKPEGKAEGAVPAERLGRFLSE